LQQLQEKRGRDIPGQRELLLPVLAGNNAHLKLWAKDFGTVFCLHKAFKRYWEMQAPLQDLNQLQQDLEWLRFQLGNTADPDAMIELQQNIKDLKRKIQIMKDKQLQPL
jgi:hypothetical protein